MLEATRVSAQFHPRIRHRLLPPGQRPHLVSARARLARRIIDPDPATPRHDMLRNHPRAALRESWLPTGTRHCEPVCFLTDVKDGGMAIWSAGRSSRSVRHHLRCRRSLMDPRWRIEIEAEGSAGPADPGRTPEEGLSPCRRTDADRQPAATDGDQVLSLRFDRGLQLVDIASMTGLSEVHLYPLPEQGGNGPRRCGPCSVRPPTT